MKVAYNGCYGGFGLSEIAMIELARLKGVDLTGMEYKYSSFANEDYTKTFDLPNDRSDKDLISVIELLGNKANGMCADLQIEEIPDGASFEITEYDGFEGVEPPRQSW
tara:strand:+ start:543 stop:866 length:324 start_codon:yes stop_codon:yes gene_type:complete